MTDTETDSDTDAGASGGAGPFILNKRPSVWWPVDIGFPADGGEIVNHRVKLKLPYLTAQRLDDADAEARELETEAWGTADDPLLEMVEDWDGVAQQRDDGRVEPIPCDGESKGNFVAHEAARPAIWRALSEVCLSQEASAKNSAPPPERGRTAGAGGRGNRRSKKAGKRSPARSSSN